MNKTFMLMNIFQALWVSADFESDFEAKFSSKIQTLKWNENALTEEEVKEMYSFMCNHPIFN